MTGQPPSLKLLYIVNPGSGSHGLNLQEEITTHFENSTHQFEIYELAKNCSLKQIKDVIKAAKADRVIAVGGDGTLKLVSECLLGSETPIGIVPAGSANGMARELGIPPDISEAIRVTIEGQPKKIHAVKVNGELCIHLADIGFNAYIVKKFDDLPQRGMWGYAKATWKALWSHHKMEAEIKLNGDVIRSEAAMVVVANATMYGTGVKINPEGDLSDNLFEVILVKTYSVLEILKIRFTDLPFNPENIETYKTDELSIKTKHKVHFQVDGEYMGKVNAIKATIVPEAINVII